MIFSADAWRPLSALCSASMRQFPYIRAMDVRPLLMQGRFRAMSLVVVIAANIPSLALAQGITCIPRDQIGEVIIEEQKLKLHLEDADIMAACRDFDAIILHLKFTESGYRHCQQKSVSLNLQKIITSYEERRKKICPE